MKNEHPVVAGFIPASQSHSEPFALCHSEGLAEALTLKEVKRKGQRPKNLAQDKLREAISFLSLDGRGAR